MIYIIIKCSIIQMPGVMEAQRLDFPFKNLLKICCGFEYYVLLPQGLFVDPHVQALQGCSPDGPGGR